jgi:hypothetical protein
MIALVVSLVAAFALGLTSWVPRILSRDIGVHDSQPGLLVVAESVKGPVALGGGFTVSLFEAGFRISSSVGTMADTVTRGAPVSALVGSVTRGGEHPREKVHATLDRVDIERLDVADAQARYTGTVQGFVDGRRRSLPLVIDVRRVDRSVQLAARVEGADGLVLHLRKVPAVVGLAPALPDRNLRLRAWWVAPKEGGERLFTWVTGTTVGVGPVAATRAVDLRPDGLVNVHVWASSLALTVSGTQRAR